MLYKGRPLTAPSMEIIVIPRAEEDIVIRAQAVTDFTEHDALNPRPKPSIVTLAGGKKEESTESKSFKEAFAAWASRKFAWTVIQSLAPTGFTWEQVKSDDPSTWENYEKELENASFTPVEVRAIIDAVATANGLNTKRIDEATKSFLAGQTPAKDS